MTSGGFGTCERGVPVPDTNKNKQLGDSIVKFDKKRRHIENIPVGLSCWVMDTERRELHEEGSFTDHEGESSNTTSIKD